MKRLSRCTMVLAISLLLVLPKKVAHGCGFYVWPGEYRFWLLQPDLTNQRELSPFFFATTYLYPGENPVEKRPSHYDQNIREWQAMTGNKASLRDIDSLLYNTTSDEFLQDFQRLARTNSFARVLQTPGNKQLLEYMQLSKRIEALTVAPDPWQENVNAGDAFGRLTDSASVLYGKVTDPAIRLRIAYQLVRLYGYNGKYRQLDRTYREKIAKVPSNSWIKMAAMYEQAIHAPGYERDYLLSRVFDQSMYNRSYCLMRYRGASIGHLLPFARNDHEQTVLYAMRALGDQGKTLHNIRFIYNREPDYKELGFLLLREINKTEDWLLTNKVTDFGPATYSWITDRDPSTWNYQRDKAYAKELFALVKQIVSDGKNKDKAVMYLCAAHLAFILEDNAVSERYLDMARRLPDLPANILTQLQVNDLLLALNRDSAFSSSTENKLMGLVLASDKKLGVHNPATLKDQLLLYAGRKLIQRGQRAKGFLLLGKTGRVIGELSINNYKSVYEEIWEKAQPADYDQMLQVLNNTPATPFEQFVSKGHLKSAWAYYELDRNLDSVKWDKAKLLDLKAGWYIRQDSLEKALEVLKQVPASIWKKYPYDTYMQGDPFYFDMYHPHQAEPTERQYNKLQLVQKMIGLKKKAEEDKPNAGLYHYALATAYYNMTWWGKHWIVSKPWWSRSDVSEYSEEVTISAFNDHYYGCTRAKKYYLLALKETSDKKLASLSCLMAGKCQENYQEYMSLARYKKESAGKHRNPYVDVLKQKSMSTAYYKELIDECETYSSFIKQINKRY